MRRRVSKVDGATISLICSSCGYGIAIRSEPPECPMCRAQAWEPGRWRPFSTLEDVTIARAAAQARGSERPTSD